MEIPSESRDTYREAVRRSARGSNQTGQQLSARMMCPWTQHGQQEVNAAQPRVRMTSWHQREREREQEETNSTQHNTTHDNTVRQ